MMLMHTNSIIISLFYSLLAQSAFAQQATNLIVLLDTTCLSTNNVYYTNLARLQDRHFALFPLFFVELGIFSNSLVVLPIFGQRLIAFEGRFGELVVVWRIPAICLMTLVTIQAVDGQLTCSFCL